MHSKWQSLDLNMALPDPTSALDRPLSSLCFSRASFLSCIGQRKETPFLNGLLISYSKSFHAYKTTVDRCSL